MERKEVAVFYDDGQSVVRKDGVLEKEINSWIYLNTGEKTIAISRERIIRIEFKDSGISESR